MDNYKLQSNEVVLYKGDVVLLNENNTLKLILTNLNFVFIPQHNENLPIEIYPIEDVKMYQGLPQIKTKANNVEIYFLTSEKEFSFNSKIELHKFTKEATKLLTGKTTAERNAEKVKNAIGLVDNTLGINTVSAVGSVIKDGVVGKVGKGINKVVGKFLKK